MAMPLGLTPDEHQVYLEALTSRAHMPKIIHELLDLDGGRIGAFPAPADGQITVDADAEVTHAWSGTIHDPGKKLRIDADSPGAGAVYSDRMIRIRHTLHVPALARDVTVTPFTGRITKADRDDALLAISCLGSADFGMRGCAPLTCEKGAGVVASIRRIMRERMGHRKFRFPQGPITNRKLVRDVSVGWNDEAWPWPTCLRLAASLGMDLFIAGDDYGVLRRPPETVSHTFMWPGDITAVPKVGHDAGAVTRVLVNGKKGVRVSVDITDVDPAHPLAGLQRNGVPIRTVHVVSDDKIGTDREALEVGERFLRRKVRAETIVETASVPSLHHDPGDLVALDTPDYDLRFPLRQFDIPTGTGGDMSVGFHKLIAKPRVKRRRRAPDGRNRS